VVALRTIRAENNVPPDKKGNAVIVPALPDEQRMLSSHAPIIAMFGRLSEVQVDCSAKKPAFAGQSVVKGTQVYLILEGLIDKKVEHERLSKEIARTSKLAESTRLRLENSNFADKAPAEVLQKEKEKYQGILSNLEKLEKNLALLSDE
jgi:valyl-tRNA synthetase